MVILLRSSTRSDTLGKTIFLPLVESSVARVQDSIDTVGAPARSWSFLNFLGKHSLLGKESSGVPNLALVIS